MSQPVVIELHIHIHADGAVSVNPPGGAAEGRSVGGADTPLPVPATTLKTPASPAAPKSKPVEPPPSSAQVEQPPSTEEAAAPAPEQKAGKVDRNPNILRKALYDATERVGKEAALDVVKRLADGSLRNVTDETFDAVLNELNALQKE